VALSTTVETGNGPWLVALDGDLDYDECALFRVSVDRILKQNPQATVIDLSALGHLDSSGLGLLLSLQRRYAAQGGRLVLVTNDAVDDILSLTRLNDLFTCVPSRDDALRLIGSS
jgi:anti-anti-sigma factor